MVRKPRSVVGAIGPGEILSVVILALAFIVPFASDDPFTHSVANQILIGITATFSVYIMLRMDLLTFATPAFMGLGGYAMALASLRGGVTDAVALIALSFAVPALFALPLGVLVLRLRGVYFVLVTFVLTEILQLVIFETPQMSGGSNGLVGVPPLNLFGLSIVDNRQVLAFAVGVTLCAAIITAVLTRYFRQHFSSIEENEVLAQSLGLVVWRYKVLGFVIAAGLSGMAGALLVNMLLMAHPTSFAPLSSVNYIAYAIVGGRNSIVGPIIGSTLLVWAANVFSIQGEYSQGLFGLLIIIAVTLAKGGIVGTAVMLWQRFGSASRTRSNAAAAESARARP
jgi:ABC-type branched-subunit amino acid transport system permease subunit